MWLDGTHLPFFNVLYALNIPVALRKE